MYAPELGAVKPALLKAVRESPKLRRLVLYVHSNQLDDVGPALMLDLENLSNVLRSVFASREKSTRSSDVPIEALAISIVRSLAV